MGEVSLTGLGIRIGPDSAERVGVEGAAASSFWKTEKENGREPSSDVSGAAVGAENPSFAKTSDD